MKLFGAERDSDLFLYDEKTGEWKKLDDKTVKWFRRSVILAIIRDAIWLLLFVMTIMLLKKLPDGTVQLSTRAVLMLLVVSTGAVAMGRRREYVILERKRGDVS